MAVSRLRRSLQIPDSVYQNRGFCYLFELIPNYRRTRRPEFDPIHWSAPDEGVTDLERVRCLAQRRVVRRPIET